MKITIRDVAEKSGVSVGTVSRVFNGYTDVSEATKKHVMQVANELGYTPNIAARTLSSKRTKTIALIINEINISLGLTFPLEVMSGVIKYTDDSDYEFVFYSINLKKQRQKTLKQFCNEHNITGVIIQGLRLSDPYYNELQTTDIPCVIIDMKINNPKVGTISIDNETASKQVAETLIQYGHKDILYISGKRDVGVSVEREAGYRKALEENNITINESLIQYGNFNEEIAYLLTKDALAENNFTAIYAISDLMALGVLKALNEMNIKVPEEISVFGFDDIVLSQYVQPPLATVKQDMEVMGFSSAELLASILEGETSGDIKRYIPHELKLRESLRERK